MSELEQLEPAMVATPEYQAWEAVHKVYMAAKVKLEEGNE
jgi:hypothetical protein